MSRDRAGSGQASLNANISWMRGRTGVAFIIFFVIITLGVRFIAGAALAFNPDTAWTLTFAVQTVTTFHMFHWIKGTPNHWDQGKWNQYTWWEQMYASSEFDNRRKVLTIIPIVLFLICLHYTYYNVSLTFVNLVSLGFSIIPKMPSLHKQRLFGINAE
eukprot:TRINITY_DN1713_c2_g2_i1.p1 TRINITY_DN1713_c2_g2~~TRINITY_DN1713_c2_g2_i1.p1  ORF type:complete len:159 (-),score=16.48 TRINITY_DN1713_c2_g2_i1:181-657(-)